MKDWHKIKGALKSDRMENLESWLATALRKVKDMSGNASRLFSMSSDEQKKPPYVLSALAKIASSGSGAPSSTADAANDTKDRYRFIQKQETGTSSQTPDATNNPNNHTP